MVTNKKVSTNLVELDEADSLITGFLDYSGEADPASVYLDLFKYNPSSPSVVTSLPLRMIHPLFGPGVKPKCILDSGAQVFVMRKDIWEQLRAPIILNKAMVMEHANSGTTMTLGLLEEYPVQLGPITVYLQIQVVENAPFEVLLGHPFFDVVSCSEISCSKGHHQIIFEQPTPIPSLLSRLDHNVLVKAYKAVADLEKGLQPAYLTTSRTRRNTFLKNSNSTNLAIIPFRSLHCLPKAVIRLLATTGFPTTAGLPVVMVSLSGDGEVAAVGQVGLSHCRTFGRVLVTYTCGSNDFGHHPFLWSYIIVSQQAARTVRYRFFQPAHPLGLQSNDGCIIYLFGRNE